MASFYCESSPFCHQTASSRTSNTYLSCGCLRGRIACNVAFDVIRTLAMRYADGVRTGHWVPFNEMRVELEKHYVAGKSVTQ